MKALRFQSAGDLHKHLDMVAMDADQALFISTQPEAADGIGIVLEHARRLLALPDILSCNGVRIDLRGLQLVSEATVAELSRNSAKGLALATMRASVQRFRDAVRTLPAQSASQNNIG